jgi:hypothetical protein
LYLISFVIFRSPVNDFTINSGNSLEAIRSFTLVDVGTKTVSIRCTDNGTPSKSSNIPTSVFVLDPANLNPATYVQLSYVDSIVKGMSIQDAFAAALAVYDSLNTGLNPNSTVTTLVDASAKQQAERAYQSCASQSKDIRLGCYTSTYNKVYSPTRLLIMFPRSLFFLII